MLGKLWQPIKINGLELSNRIVRSATHDGKADESGAVTERSVDYYRDLGKGGIGLIITGHAYISLSGRAGPHQYAIYSDEFIPGWKRLVKAIHDEGGKIAMQISHAGANSHSPRNTNLVPPVVSELPEFAVKPHKQLTDDEIEGIIEDFVSASLRVREAGFDAVQFHGAHGYLMSQFASPLYNHRLDRWGGSPENRRRFHLEVIRKVRKAVGNDYPLLIKFGVMDEREGGMSLSEGLETCRQMAEAGVDGIEVSVGVGRGPEKLNSDEIGKPVYLEQAAAVKRAVNVPVMVVTGIRSPDIAERVIDTGAADMVSMSRPFIREPFLALRWQKGDTAPAKCISCNRCFPTIRHPEGLECGEERRIKTGKG